VNVLGESESGSGEILRVNSSSSRGTTGSLLRRAGGVYGFWAVEGGEGGEVRSQSRGSFLDRRKKKEHIGASRVVVTKFRMGSPGRRGGEDRGGLRGRKGFVGILGRRSGESQKNGHVIESPRDGTCADIQLKREGWGGGGGGGGA